MGISYWNDAAEQFYIATNMQDVALNDGLWQAYVSCGAKGRVAFQQCARDHLDWSLDGVLAYAAYEDAPPPQVTQPTPQPKPVTTSKLFLRGRGKEEDTDDRKFITWMGEVTQALKADKGLAYGYGKKRVLKDGTVAVSVSVHRGQSFLRDTSFVFHYHRGSKGAQVGSTEGSKWHFKPFDGAKKWVRVPDYDFGKLDATMVRTVKEIAKGK